jgi:hypothetical protein
MFRVLGKITSYKKLFCWLGICLSLDYLNVEEFMFWFRGDDWLIVGLMRLVSMGNLVIE